MCVCVHKRETCCFIHSLRVYSVLKVLPEMTITEVHFVMEKLKKTAVCNDIAVVSVFCKRAVVGELTLSVCLGRPKST